MAAREDLGSWLEGPSSGSGDGPNDRGPTARGPVGSPPGGRLGLPPSGPGSLAPLGRRVAALTIDWLLCLAISGAFFGGEPIVTLQIFAVENLLLVGTLGHTLGHRLLGIHVRRADAPGPNSSAPRPVGLARAALRTLLICLVIPAVIWDGDGRGLHDRAAGTLVVRL